MHGAPLSGQDCRSQGGLYLLGATSLAALNGRYLPGLSARRYAFQMEIAAPKATTLLIGRLSLACLPAGMPSRWRLRCGPSGWGIQLRRCGQQGGATGWLWLFSVRCRGLAGAPPETTLPGSGCHEAPAARPARGTAALPAPAVLIHRPGVALNEPAGAHRVCGPHLRRQQAWRGRDCDVPSRPGQPVPDHITLAQGHQTMARHTPSWCSPGPGLHLWMGTMGELHVAHPACVCLLQDTE